MGCGLPVEANGIDSRGVGRRMALGCLWRYAPPPQAGLDQPAEVSGQHGTPVADRRPGAVVFDLLVGMQRLLADLAAPLGGPQGRFAL